MKRRQLVAVTAVLLSLAFVSTAATAQGTSGGVKYDENCKPLSEKDQALVSENILLNAIAPLWNKPCRGVEFVENLLKKKDFHPDKIDADDVFEASKPNITARSNPYGIPEGLSDVEFNRQLAQAKYRARNPNWKAEQAANARRISNPADEAVAESNARDEQQLRGDPVVLPPATPGGSPVVFQPVEAGGTVPTKISEINGEGVLLSADGMKKGPFKGGKLNGYGEEIDPNGTWRGGTYQYGRNVDQVWEVRTVDGKTYVVSGGVVDGKLDGMIMRVYADGSTQFEDWEGGKLMQVGNRAPKGQSALAPQTRYKPVEEAEMEDAYKHTGPRTKIAPGTTFDPARTTLLDCPEKNGTLLKRTVSCVINQLPVSSVDFRSYQAEYAPKINSFCRDIITKYYPWYLETAQREFPLDLPSRGGHYQDLFPWPLLLRDDALRALSQRDLEEIKSEIVNESVGILQRQILELRDAPMANGPITQKERDSIDGYAQMQVCVLKLKKTELR